MKEIITAMLLWIGANTGYNVDLPHPTIKKLDQTALEYAYSKGKGVSKNVELHGFYESKTIYLPKSFNEYDAWYKGILLHELLHYVQDMNQVKVACGAELEKDVWPLQKKYLLEMHGVEWHYDEMWFKLISNCQIH